MTDKDRADAAKCYEADIKKFVETDIPKFSRELENAEERKESFNKAVTGEERFLRLVKNGRLHR